MNNLDKLKTEPWILALEAAHLVHYETMRVAEEAWRARCREAGCIAVDGRGRSSVLLVPPDVTDELPPFDTATHDAWRATCVELARAQGKHQTIGSRSSRTPLWLQPDGTWAATRPADQVVELTHREQLAARGARITGEEAVGYLESRAATLTQQIENSVRAGQQKRAEGQRERLEAALEAVAEARAVLAEAAASGLSISAQLISGHSWRLHAKWASGAATPFTVSNIGLLSAAKNCAVSEAPRRGPRLSGREVIVAEAVRFILG